jgi:hypothetical protein
MIAIAVKEKMGIILTYMDPKSGLANRKLINIWLHIGLRAGDLLLFTGLQLAKNWEASIRLISVVEDEADLEKADRLLHSIGERIRTPKDTEYKVLSGDPQQQFAQSPSADINLFGMPNPPDWKHMLQISETVKTSCMFIKDSGQEDVKA